MQKMQELVSEDGGFRIANDGLTTLTVLIAESKPEKKNMVAVSMNMSGK